jgi:ribonuclease BN (tRNA processing enzyme)
MLTFKVIGCAPGFPHPRLAHSSYLVSHNDRLLLFDIGEGASSAMRRCQIDPLQIGTIFVSHFHPDHWIGLPMFMQWNYLLKRKERLDLFLPSEAVAGVRKLLDLTYLFPQKLGFEVELHKVAAGFSFEMTNLSVRPHLNSHLRGHSDFLKTAQLANKMECYSYVILAGGKKIIYSADLSGIADLLPFLDDTDLLAIDGMHVDLSQIAEVALSHRVRRILLTHLPEGFDFATLKAGCARHGFKRLYQAKEGSEFSFQ